MSRAGDILSKNKQEEEKDVNKESTQEPFGDSEETNEAYNEKRFVNLLYKLQDMLDKMEDSLIDREEVEADKGLSHIRNEKKFYKVLKPFKIELEAMKTQLRKG